MSEYIQVKARINASVYKRFAYFDTFRLKKRYRSPILFALIMTAFAIVCFLLKDREQNELIGGVLLAIGLLMPLAYFVMFESSVRTQIKAMEIDKNAREFYSLSLSDAAKGIEVESEDGKQKVQVEWEKAFGAYRVDGCIYLYVLPTKAFLLPDGCASTTDDELFALLTRMLGEKRVQDLRKKKK